MMSAKCLALALLGLLALQAAASDEQPAAAADDVAPALFFGGGTNDPVCNVTQPPVSALALISTNPSLTTLATAAAAVDANPDPFLINWLSVLAAPLDGLTVIAPTNDAFAAYLKRIKVNVLAPPAGLNPTYYINFLLQYHVLKTTKLVGVLFKSGGLNVGEAVPTLYAPYGDAPHTVSYLWRVARKAAGRTFSGTAGASLAWFVDEIGQKLKVLCQNLPVIGTGRINIITRVAEPNDLFPSVEAAATAAKLTTLATAVTRVGLLDTLEKTNLWLFAPTNDAFAAIGGINKLNNTQLTPVLQNHACAFPTTQAVFTRTETSCQTLFGLTVEISPSATGKATLVQLRNSVGTAVLAANILADVITPFSRTFVIDKVLVPPTK